MRKSNSPDTGGQNPQDGAPASEVQAVPLGADIESLQGDIQPLVPITDTQAAKRKSLSGDATESLDELSSQALSAGGALASKALALGSSGAAKTAEIGKHTYAAALEASRSAIESGKKAYAGSKIEVAVNCADAELEQRGAKRAVKETTEALVGKLDQLTGKRLVELLERKLQLQDAYNDVLATRLAEALERIANLEAEIKDLAAHVPTTAPNFSPEPHAGRSER